MRFWTHAGIALISLSRLSAAFPAGSESTKWTVQSLTRKLPSCARGCFTTLVPESQCESADLSCFCSDAKFNEEAAACISSKCTVQETLTATRIEKNACEFPKRDDRVVTRSQQWTLFGLAVTAVILRFLARSPALGGKGYGWDDATILLCVALLLPLNILLNKMLDLGLGTDTWTLKFQDITDLLFYFWVAEFTYFAIVSLTKVSILLLYLRLFPATETWFRNGCFGLIGASAITIIPAFLTVLLQCDPISFAWLRWDGSHSGTCINTVAQVVALAGVNIALDLSICLLPIPLLLKLNITRIKKMAVLAIFLVGLFVTVCSMVRIQFLVRWGVSNNPTWQYNPSAMWSSVECNLGVFTACMPPLAGPTKRVWKSIVRDRINPVDSGHICRPSSFMIAEISGYFGNEVASKPSQTAVSSRPLDSTEEVELVDRDLDQNAQSHDG